MFVDNSSKRGKIGEINREQIKRAKLWQQMIRGKRKKNQKMATRQQKRKHGKPQADDTAKHASTMQATTKKTHLAFATLRSCRKSSYGWSSRRTCGRTGQPTRTARVNKHTNENGASQDAGHSENCTSQNAGQ